MSWNSTLIPFWDCLPASVFYCEFWLVIEIRLLSHQRLSWNAAKHSPLSYVSFDRTHHVNSHFHNKKYVVQNVFTSYYFHMNWNSGKPTYKFAQTCCIAFLPCIGLDSTYCLYYLVFHVHEHQFVYVEHSTWNWTLDSTRNWYLVIKYQQSNLTRKLGTADDHVSELCIELEALYFSGNLF
jgi:hypothetical protein